MPSKNDAAPSKGFKPRARFGELIREYRNERARWDQQQLAHFAGIANRATISKIENGGGCDPETARGIISALDQELDFRWRELRELAVEYLLTEELQKSKRDRRIIGLIVPGISHSLYWGPVVGAIETEATAHKYLVVLCQHHNDIDRMLEGLAFFENFDSLRGVIAVPAFGIEEHSRADLEALNRVVHRLAGRTIPTVFLDRRVDIKTPVPYIGLDNRYAAYLAVRRLIKDGHVCIGGLFDLEHASPQKERLLGFRDALEEANIPFDPALVKHGIEVHPHARQDSYERYGRRRGLQNARELLELRPRPTAIFCSTGDLALRIRDAAGEATATRPALKVPADLSIIGFDNLHEFDLTDPKITRVQYNTEDYGRRAFQKLHRLIRDHNDSAARAEELLGKDDIKVEERASIAAICTLPTHAKGV